VFFRTGEVLEGEGELGVGDGAEVTLEHLGGVIGFDRDADGGLGVTLGDDGVGEGVGGEKFCELGGLISGDNEIEIVEGFFVPAVGSSDGGLVDIWVLAEFFEEDFSERGGGSEAVAVGVKVEVMDGFEDFFFCFFPEAREFGDLAVEAGFFERADGVDAAELVEGFEVGGHRRRRGQSFRWCRRQSGRRGL